MPCSERNSQCVLGQGDRVLVSGQMRGDDIVYSRVTQRSRVVYYIIILSFVTRTAGRAARHRTEPVYILSLQSSRVLRSQRKNDVVETSAPTARTDTNLLQTALPQTRAVHSRRRDQGVLVPSVNRTSGDEWRRYGVY